jgi:hypothetical protein
VRGGAVPKPAPDFVLMAQFAVGLYALLRSRALA